MQHNWDAMTALELGNKIAKNLIDPVELAEYFLDRIKDHDQTSSIYVRQTKARALQEAEAARMRAKAETTRSSSPADRCGTTSSIPVSAG